MPDMDIATRAVLVALKVIGKTTDEVVELTSLDARTVNEIYGRAIMAGFDPNVRPLRIRDSYF